MKEASVNPRVRLVVLGQSTLPILVCLVVVAVVFTVAPATLDHAPVAFETRGAMHHVWHYGLLAGSLLALFGALSTHQRGLMLELVGLIVVVAALALNLTALVFASADGEPVGGIDLALRVGAMLQLGVRIWILVVRPHAEIQVARNA